MGNKIRIKCNVTNTEFSVGYSSDYIQEGQHANFSRFMAKEIARLLVQAIDDQRYKSRWKPLTPGYKDWKKSKGWSTKIWEATGTLKFSIDYDNVSDLILVGIDPYIKYDDGTSVLQVARWMEYGTYKMPERPLFRPILQYVRGNVKYFYNKFLKEGGDNNEISYHKWSDRILQEYVRQHNLRIGR